MNDIPPYAYPTVHVTLSSTDGHMGYSHLLATVIDITASSRVLISVAAPVFSSPGCIPRNGLARSYGNPMLLFFEELLYCLL